MQKSKVGNLVLFPFVRSLPSRDNDLYTGILKRIAYIYLQSSISMKWILLGSILTLILLNIQTSNSQTMDKENPFFPIDSTPFNKSYEEHVVDFTKKFVAIPMGENPIDNTATKCKYTNSMSNSSEILYVMPHKDGAAFVNCDIPSGKSLLIPVLVSIFAQGEGKGSPEEFLTPESILDNARADSDNVLINDPIREKLNANVKINDVEYNVANFRINTTLFTADYPPKAIFNTYPGVQQVAVDGYYVITKPLEPGNYKIHFQGALDDNSNDMKTDFVTESTYNFNVR